jgi:hypothetical protein
MPLDDSALPQGLTVRDIKGTGEIKLKAHFVKNLQRASVEDGAILENKHLGKISEKALKGQTLSHQIVLVITEVTHLPSVLIMV